MTRAVFDTNVLVSGFLSPFGPPGRIVEWLRSGVVQAVLDDRIVSEYAEVLARPAFRLPAADVALVLDAILAWAFHVEADPASEPLRLPDPHDAPFLACARAADAPIVTGNARHFPRRVTVGIEVLTPAEFVARQPTGGTAQAHS
jgi:putative PIN family toxin of toxin-antitoxin system